MGKGLRILGVVALGCLGALLLYAASWILYFANYRESDVSDRGYYAVAWVIYVAASLWGIFIARWLSKIIARTAASTEQDELPHQ